MIAFFHSELRIRCAYVKMLAHDSESFSLFNIGWDEEEEEEERERSGDSTFNRSNILEPQSQSSPCHSR